MFPCLILSIIWDRSRVREQCTEKSVGKCYWKGAFGSPSTTDSQLTIYISIYTWWWEWIQAYCLTSNLNALKANMPCVNITIEYLINWLWVLVDDTLKNPLQFLNWQNFDLAIIFKSFNIYLFSVFLMLVHCFSKRDFFFKRISVMSLHRVK